VPSSTARVTTAPNHVASGATTAVGSRPGRDGGGVHDEVMTTIEDAVAACIRLKRWDDLEAAIRQYATVLGVDPSLLLFTAMVRPLARHALTLTDPRKVDECAGHVRCGIELANSRWSLRARRARGGAVRDRCASESSRTRSSSARISATFGRPSRMLASL
jgi:hypothetical protein